jgi:hypothetical protein
MSLHTISPSLGKYQLEMMQNIIVLHSCQRRYIIEHTIWKTLCAPLTAPTNHNKTNLKNKKIAYN